MCVWVERDLEVASLSPKLRSRFVIHVFSLQRCVHADPKWNDSVEEWNAGGTDSGRMDHC